MRLRTIMVTPTSLRHTRSLDSSQKRDTRTGSNRKARASASPARVWPWRLHRLESGAMIELQRW